MWRVDFFVLYASLYESALPLLSDPPHFSTVIVKIVCH
nr:MAG TPA: hypothetical protein [Caudoviricetes sp.]